MSLGYKYTEEDKRNLCAELRKCKHMDKILTARIYHACKEIKLKPEPTIQTVNIWMSMYN